MTKTLINGAYRDFRYASLCWREYLVTGSTDQWCYARVAERTALIELATALNIIPWWDMYPFIALGEDYVVPSGPFKEEHE